MGRKYPQSDVKILYGNAALRCSFPGCQIILEVEDVSGEKKQIGKIAHIVAHSKNGPRADSSYPQDKLDTYDNWILLCGTHHDTIDGAEDKYTAEILRKMKKDHESWVVESLTVAGMNIGFEELELTIKAILNKAIPKLNLTSEEENFALTPLRQKIKKNNLTESTHTSLARGLSRSHVVGQFIEARSKRDANFPDRLKAGFRKEYNRLVDENILSDDLFKSMVYFASGNSHDFNLRAAGEMIVVHLFEICEVFEQ